MLFFVHGHFVLICGGPEIDVLVAHTHSVLVAHGQLPHGLGAIDTRGCLAENAQGSTVVAA